MQVSGAVQVPPFWQGLPQAAGIVKKIKKKTRDLMLVGLDVGIYCSLQHTLALRQTPTPLSIRLAGSTVCSLQCVAYITGVGHYRVVGCTGETALTVCGSTRITTVDGCNIRDFEFRR